MALRPAANQSTRFQQRSHVGRLGERRAARRGLSPRKSRAARGSGAGSGTEVDRSGLRRLSARLGRQEVQRFALRLDQRRSDAVAGRARLLFRSSRRARGGVAALFHARGAHEEQAGIHRLGSLERAARHQLGRSDVHAQRGILFLPVYRRAVSQVAAVEIRIARRAQSRVVPPLRVMG